MKRVYRGRRHVYQGYDVVSVSVSYGKSVREQGPLLRLNRRLDDRWWQLHLLKPPNGSIFSSLAERALDDKQDNETTE